VPFIPRLESLGFSGKDIKIVFCLTNILPYFSGDIRTELMKENNETLH
jgi:hypothetical protein